MQNCTNKSANMERKPVRSTLVLFSLHIYTIDSISIDKSKKQMYNIKRHEKQSLIY